MREKPEIRYRGIPGAGYGAERRKPKLVYRVHQEVKRCEENERDEEIIDKGPKVRERRDGVHGFARYS